MAELDFMVVENWSPGVTLGYEALVKLGLASQAPPLPGLPLKKAALFVAPAGKRPKDLFTHQASEHTILRCSNRTSHRMVRHDNDREMLIYVDGSCLDQNSPNDFQIRRAGSAWVFKPEPYPTTERATAIRLEARGPSGQEHAPTSNRAELRAALGALQFRAWHGEGWRKVVIASDSEYLVFGITQRIEQWVAHGWQTAANRPVKNRDLWEALLDRINHFAAAGTEIVFWKIPRDQNTEADEAAKRGSLMPNAPKYETVHGILV